MGKLFAPSHHQEPFFSMGNFAQKVDTMEKQTSETPSNEHKETNIDGDVSKSVIISGNGNVVNMGGENKQKRPRRKTKPKPRKVNWSNPAIVAAIIGAFAMIVVALLNSPLIVPSPTPTATPSSTPMETASVTPTEYMQPTPIIVVVTSTEQTPTASPTFTSTPRSEDTAMPSYTPEPESDAMTALLKSTAEDGKAPLLVNFDARTSYVTFANGSTASCGNNPFCSYSFAVYRDSRFVESVKNNTGTLSYTFGAKGKYSVTVYVCRGEACADDGATIHVR